MITFVKFNASGDGWSQCWFNVYRDGDDTGYSAYEKKHGVLSVEKNDHWYGEFNDLAAVEAYFVQRFGNI
jgi:hypothetical protein